MFFGIPAVGGAGDGGLRGSRDNQLRPRAVPDRALAAFLACIEQGAYTAMQLLRSEAVGGYVKSPPIAIGTGSPDPDDDDRRRRIKQALERLPGKAEREIMLLRFFHGLELSEIASRMNLPREEVLTRYAAALKSIESDLGGSI